MSGVEVISDGDTLGHSWILLAVKVRRIVTETHKTAAVHLPGDAVATGGIHLCPLHHVVRLILDICGRVLFVCGNGRQQTRLIIEFPLYLFVGDIKLSKLHVQEVTLADKLLRLEFFDTHQLFEVKSFVALIVELLGALVNLTHVIARLKFILLGQALLVFAERIDLLVEGFDEIVLFAHIIVFIHHIFH